MKDTANRKYSCLNFICSSRDDDANPVGWGRESGKKVKLVGGDKNSLIGQKGRK